MRLIFHFNSISMDLCRKRQTFPTVKYILKQYIFYCLFNINIYKYI